MSVSHRCDFLIGCLFILSASSVAANQAPTLEPLSDVTVSVGEAINLRVEPNDPEGIVPGLRLVNYPDGAMFSDNGDGTRTFYWVPDERHVGVRNVTFEAVDAIDESLVTRRTIALTVQAGSAANGNLPPRFESLIDRAINLGDAFNFRVVPFDPEGVVPAMRVENLPQGASFEDNRDGTRQFRWTPSDAHVGENILTFTVYEDADPDSRTSQSIKLTVNGQTTETGSSPPPALVDGDAPQFIGLADQFVFLGETLELVVRARSDHGSVPGLAIDRLPTNSSFQDNGDGTRTFRWFPYPVNIGDTWITFISIDAYDPSLRTQQTIKITVERDPNNPVNFPPVINGIRNPTIRVGDTLNQIVQPVDPDFTVPNLSALNQPADASFVDNGDGTRDFRWPTDQNDLGDHTFYFRATDSEDSALQFESSFTVSVVEPESLNRSGERLRDLADQRGFFIGFAAMLNSSKLADNELYRQIASDEFNMITPENSHKMGWIQPQRGFFDWEDADDLANFASEKGMVLHGHPLVWYTQLPGWVQNLDPSEAQTVMRDHINAMVGRYRGQVKVWDVVNEAINDVDGQLRQSVWYKGMGEDYIRIAFETARAADPDAVLVYNDYDVAWFNTKSDAMYNLLKKELERGTPIDAVGFQMHLRSDFTDFGGMRDNLQRFADLGLDIYITEFDVTMSRPDEEQVQAEIYRRSLEVCLAQPKCKAMQSWGYTDRYSWRSSNTPLLLNDKYIAKPAYYAWQDTLKYFNR